MVGDHMVQRLESVHEKWFLHRDIKPDNFLMGLGKKQHIVYMIDFGLAKRYKDPRTGEHIPYRDGKSLTGTARYASANTHLGIEQSRRDDLESVGFVMVYFLKGKLPWQGIPAKTKKSKYDKIKEKKISTTIEELSKGWPKEIGKYLQYWRGLKFDEKPDYNRLRKLLQDVSERMNYEHDYYYYDWILKNSSMSKRMSKSNLPIPPKVQLDQESNENNVDETEDIKQTSRDNIVDTKNNEMIITNSTLKQRNISVEPPIIRRDNNYNPSNFITGPSSYNNTKYGAVNPISGMINKEFNAISSRKDNPTALMTATGIISSDPTKYTKYNSRMGESALNFANETTLRQTTTNAYPGIGIPPLKKNFTSDNFNNDKPYPMGRGSSQNVTGSRGKGDFNSYFRSSAQAMFGSQAIAMPRISTNQVRAKF